MSNWSSSVYDGENPQQSGWYRCSYTRDNQQWIDELIASRTVLERRVKALRKEKKEKEGIRCGASCFLCRVKSRAVTDMLRCYYLRDS